MGSVLIIPRLLRLVKRMQPAQPAIKVILYDLDGTIVDHFDAIHAAIVHAQEALGVPPSTYDKVRTTVGGGIELTLTRLMGPELAPRALPYYEEYLTKNMFTGLRALPGAEGILEALHARGLRQAVLTNKQGDFARAIIEHLGWNRWLDEVFGVNDTPWRKPAREFVLHAVAKLGGTPGDTLMVGDSPFDIEAATNGGLRCHAVATGSHTRAQLLAHQPAPEAVFDSLTDLGRETFGLKA
jgi:phosphoglycolate phosphatase